MNYYEGDNIGSLKTIEVIRQDLPTGWKPVTLPVGATWTNIPFKEESAILTIKTEETDNGLLYTYAANFFIQNMRDEVDQVLLLLCGVKATIFRLTDMNDRVYIIGSPDCPALLNMSASTGQKYAAENGTTFNISAEQPSPAVSE